MAAVSSTKAVTANEVVTLNLSGQSAADYISGSVWADQGGSIAIKQSGDGTNWDISTVYTVPVNDGKGFDEKIILPFLQVVFTNANSSGNLRLFVRATSAGARP